MRISTTTLESFRLYMSPDHEWMTEQSLIDTILGKFVPTVPVLIGSAFGKVLETPDAYQIPHGYRCGNYSFSDATMAEPLALMDRRGVYEAKAVKAYGPHDVVAMADQLIGARLIEHKTTLGQFDFDKYAASYQWRFMADIFLPASVTYHVFVLHDHENGIVELKDVHSFTLYPYANLHQDCCDLLGRFVDYVTTKGLDGYLRDRQQAA